MMNVFTTGRVAALCLAASILLLFTVYLFQIAGYEPCQLCLYQRKFHWAALGVSALALILSSRASWAGVARALMVVLVLVYIGSAGMAAYHAGVEYGFWPAPPCAATTGAVSADNLLESLNNPIRAVPCDKAAWTLFGISMAGYNFLISLLLAGVAALGARRRVRSIFR